MNGLIWPINHGCHTVYNLWLFSSYVSGFWKNIQALNECFVKNDSMSLKWLFSNAVKSH